MKKLILAVAVLALGVNAQAQESNGLEGRSFIMGQFGYSQSYDSYKSNVDKSTRSQSYSVLPAYGYFISPSVAIGGALGYVGGTEGTGVAKKTSNEFIIQPLVRKYWNVANNLYIFGQASIPVSFGSTKGPIEGQAGTHRQEYTNYGVEIKPGIDYLLSNHWSLEASVGLLSWTANNPKHKANTNDFNVGLNSGLIGGLNIGVKYIF